MAALAILAASLVPWLSAHGSTGHPVLVQHSPVAPSLFKLASFHFILQEKCHYLYQQLIDVICIVLCFLLRFFPIIGFKLDLFFQILAFCLFLAMMVCDKFGIHCLNSCKILFARIYSHLQIFLNHVNTNKNDLLCSPSLK